MNLPVRLYTAAVSKKVTFRLLDRTTGQRVRQQLVSSGPAPRDVDQVKEAASEVPASMVPASTAVASNIAHASALGEDSASPAEFIVPHQEIIKGYEIGGGRRAGES